MVYIFIGSCPLAWKYMDIGRLPEPLVNALAHALTVLPMGTLSNRQRRQNRWEDQEFNRRISGWGGGGGGGGNWGGRYHGKDDSAVEWPLTEQEGISLKETKRPFTYFGLKKIYLISNNILITEQLGRAANKITYISTARILHKWHHKHQFGRQLGEYKRNL